MTQDVEFIVSVETHPEVLMFPVPGLPGPAGEPGPTGPPGVTERTEFTVVAGFTLQAYRLVVPRVQEPNVRHALPNFAPHANRPLWLTTHAALAGEPVRVIAQGIVMHDAWDWVQAPIYLGPDGTLTQEVPEAPTAAFAVQVGYPTGPDAMYLGPGPAIILTA